jgi:uncharacterized SAM-binding protein YcdF (DUF218 family)
LLLVLSASAGGERGISSMLFTLKKIVTSVITLPGILIVFLLITGIYGLLKRGRLWALNIILGFVIYCISISPVSNAFIGGIELDCSFHSAEEVDAIILLGGGIVEGVRDLSGSHAPSTDMMARIVDTVRIYKLAKMPVIVSGGVVGSSFCEALVVKRFLIDLGIPEEMILTEVRSRDTVENARFVKEIFSERGYKRGLLITSAYHMRRALFIFRSEGLDVVPHSSGFLCGEKKYLDMIDFLPNIHHLRKSAIALREMIGFAFYSIKYAILK